MARANYFVIVNRNAHGPVAEWLNVETITKEREPDEHVKLTGDEQKSDRAFGNLKL